jgi:hypothetical protein
LDSRGLTGILDRGSFRVFEFFLPPPIAMFFDQMPGLGEVVLRGLPRVVRRSIFTQSKQPRPMQMDVRHVQGHRAALGDFKGLIEISLRALGAVTRACKTAQPGASEETAKKELLHASAADAVHGVLEVLAAGIESFERYMPFRIAS